MSDSYKGVTTPDPERERLFRSVFRFSQLEAVAEAVSVASEVCSNIYVERRGDQYRWSVATWEGGPYPHLRSTAVFLQMDFRSLSGAGCRVIGGGWCVQAVTDEIEPDAWNVFRFNQIVSIDEASSWILTSVERD
jgi:hypothetical protein